MAVISQNKMTSSLILVFWEKSY